MFATVFRYGILPLRWWLLVSTTSPHHHPSLSLSLCRPAPSPSSAAASFRKRGVVSKRDAPRGKRRVFDRWHRCRSQTFKRRFINPSTADDKTGFDRRRFLRSKSDSPVDSARWRENTRSEKRRRKDVVLGRLGNPLEIRSRRWVVPKSSMPFADALYEANAARQADSDDIGSSDFGKMGASSRVNAARLKRKDRIRKLESKSRWAPVEFRMERAAAIVGGSKVFLGCGEGEE